MGAAYDERWLVICGGCRVPAGARGTGSGSGRSDRSGRKRMAGIVGCAWLSRTPATGSFEELASMACVVRPGASGQPSSDGIFCLYQPDVSTAHPPRSFQSDGADDRPWIHLVAMQCPVADRVVLDRRLCHGVGVAADRTSECRFVLPAMRVLPGEISGGIPVAVLPAPLYVSCGLGRSPRSANFADQAEDGTHSGGGYHAADESYMEQQRLMDSQLGIELAGMVPGCNGMGRSG